MGYGARRNKYVFNGLHSPAASEPLVYYVVVRFTCNPLSAGKNHGLLQICDLLRYGGK